MRCGVCVTERVLGHAAGNLGSGLAVFQFYDLELVLYPQENYLCNL